jgi:hypothetical protein
MIQMQGTSPKKLVAVSALLVVAVALLWRNLVSPATPVKAQPLAAAERSLPPDPALHLAELDRLRAIQYHGALRNLFEEQAIADPVATAKEARMRRAARAVPIQPPAVTPAGPVLPPPFPLKFYGYATPESASKQVFLQLGDDVFVVVEGQLVAKRYLVQQIGRNSVEVKDTMTQQVQTIPLIQG